MKIHGICVAKNEVDIITQSLTEASKWCDFIYVYDNGSTDGTWEVVRRLSERISHVIPFKSVDKVFSDYLRGEVFNAYKTNASEGDWWCRLDADEFYIDDPRSFLTKIKRPYNVVWAIHLQYYFTDCDMDNFIADPSRYEGTIPVQEKCRFYVSDSSEPRFFRHRDRLSWVTGAWPRHMGLVYPERIKLRHYQYRSPLQIQVRLKTRIEAKNRGVEGFPHWNQSSWKAVMRDARQLNYDAGDGNYIIDHELLPNHLEPVYKRVIKRLMHFSRMWP